MPEEQAKSARLQQTLDTLDRLAEEIRSNDEGICLGKLTEELGPAAFCFVALLLAVPFFQPISLGPLTMASGSVFMVLGWQMGKGWTFLHLPKRARNWHLRGKGWIRVLNFCRRILVWLSRWTRPRLLSWIDGPAGARRIGWMIFIGGGLLAIPFAVMPLNNTFPALMIFFAAVAWLERDGFMVLISLFWGVVTVTYFATAGWILFRLGIEGLQWLQGM